LNTSNLAVLGIPLRRQHHRALVILSGSSQWQLPYIQSLWTQEERVLWIGGENSHIPLTQFHYPIEAIETKQLIHHLGQEVDGVILDASKGLSANTLGIASGMIKGGGLFILLTPDISEWPNFPNPDNARFLNTPLTIEQAHPYFIQHLIQQWQERKNQVVWLQEQESVAGSSLKIEEFSKNACCKAEYIPQNLPTTDQQAAIQAIHTVAFGHRKRPLVITADRGRGKSSILGLAAIACLLEGKQHIVLTASRLDQTQQAFIQAAQALEEVHASLNIEIKSNQPGLVSFEYQSALKTFEFIAPDQLVQVPSTADMLLVDEAAHLPTPLLTQLLTRHHRMVFATTLHGYEGSGRGFELRFKKTLNQMTPGWKSCTLSQPIRWAEDDPLEQAINRALMLQPEFVSLPDFPNQTPGKASENEPVSHKEHSESGTEQLGSNGDEEGDEQAIQSTAEVTFKVEDIASLSKQPKRLHALFSLLVQAHYQTTPNDLQQLLSAPNLTILTASQNSTLVGVVLCVKEGKIMPQDERVHGHLVPQLLVHHYAVSDFMMLSSWRIMRIAVHPQLQRQGIGEQMIKHLKQAAAQQKVDYLSSSFGASKELLPFWFKQNFTPIHVGVKRDKASGSHNVVVYQSTSAMAQQALACIQRAFQAQFPHVLIESLPYLHASMVMAILQTFKFKTQDPLLEASVREFRNEHRGYESVSGHLWNWSLRNSHILAKAEQVHQFIWIDKVLKKQSWQSVAQQHGLPGRKGVEKVMREMLIQALPEETLPKTLKPSIKTGRTTMAPRY